MDGGGGHRSKWVGISGSLRKSSANRGLLRAVDDIVGRELADKVGFEIVEIEHLPFVNPDLEADGHFPDSVARFRQKVLEADAIILACPEYNYSIPAVLKNALDWGSRPPNVWGDKAAAVMSAAGGSGGTRAQCHVRQIGIFLDLHFVNKPEVFVRAHDGKFDENGDLIDSQLRSQIRALISSLRSFSVRLRPIPS